MPTLCVTLACRSAEELLAADRRLRADGVGLVEWRLDHLAALADPAVSLVERAAALVALVRQRPGSTIVTFRLPADGGLWTAPESERRALYAAAAEAGVEYVDLEQPLARAWARSGTTRRIVSLHDFEATPADLPALAAQLAAADADVVKLATWARSLDDVRRMLAAVETAPRPTVGLCMGPTGTPARMLAGRCGSPWTYAAPDAGPPPAPGQLPYRVLRDLYRFECLPRGAEVYAVIGDPIAHSKSPHVHNAAFAALGREAIYVPLHVRPDDLPGLFDHWRSWGLRGLSITIPHKEACLTRVDEVEPTARAVGAVNTIVVREGRLLGYNTDVAGAIDSLDAAAGPDRDPDWLAGRETLVLGAGGAAKGIVYGLAERGARVRVAARTMQRAEALARELGATAVAWDARHDVPAELVVNCSPVGMHPHVGESPFDVARLPAGAIVFDTVYNPEETRLLAEARARGLRTVPGSEMFLRQAARQCELFTGQPPPLEAMRAAFRSAMGAAPSP